MKTALKSSQAKPFKGIKVSDLMVRCLEREGVRFIFGIPGEENLDLLESIRKSKTIRFILTRHEQAAGFMAATVGRLTGCAGVALATLGPGATNLVTAAAFAQLGGMPMLMITGQKPIKKSKQGHFQIVDVVVMMRPLTKYTKQIVVGDYAPFRVREAFRIAEEERPGAVHLELPEDVAAETSAVPVIEKSLSRRPIAEEKSIRAAVEMIEKAKRPLLLVGAASNRKRTSRMLRQFVDRYGIFFFDTQMGQGVIDSRHPYYLGNAALTEFDFVHCAIRRADLIINAGHDVIEKPPFLMEPTGQRVIHIDFTAAAVDPVYFPQCEVIGDIANSIWQIMQHLKKSKNWDFAYYKKIKGLLDEDIKSRSRDSRFPMIPQRLVADVRKAMPEDGIVALDNGIYKIWFARNYPVYEENTLLLDNALGTMGAGLPAAIAAKLVHPKREVLGVVGDGGFMMNSQELETAVRLKLNLVILILRDDAYGMIQWKQRGLGFPDFGLTFKNPDFIAYAQSYGAHGSKISKADDLIPRIRACQKKGGVHLIDVPMDYSENEKILNVDMKNRTCAL